MPLIPFACYLAAHGVYISYKIFEHTRLKFFVATSLVIALILPLRETLLDANELAQGDTRTHAYRWSRQNISENSLILVESYSPQLPTESYRLIQPGFMDEDFQPASTKYYRALGVIGELEDTKPYYKYLVIQNFHDYTFCSPTYCTNTHNINCFSMEFLSELSMDF
jgi:hypothetical protein